MALYQRLLLSTGGGIINSARQDERTECAVVAIGLGGTGISCLKNLKKQVYSRLRPDDPNAPIPEYSHIRFLAVDSDKGSLRSDGAFDTLDEATEYFSLSTRDIHGMLDHAKILATAPAYQWLKTENRERGERGLSAPSVNSSPVSIRQIGRLLIMLKSAEFVARVQSVVVDAARDIRDDAELTIHIFTGLGGGTGSGIFLDVCYLVQEALDRMNLKGKASICGYVFLPDVNLSRHIGGKDSFLSRHIKANSFAAMKELDYCMDFRNNHGRWDQEYHGFHVGPVQDPPVDACHLISACDVQGRTTADGFAHAMNAVSNFVMQFLIKPDQNSGRRPLTMASHIDACRDAMRTGNKTAGARHQYCVLGSANAVVPVTEMTTYLTSRLFEETADLRLRRPTDQEVAQFAEHYGLSYDPILNSLLSGTTYRMPVIDLDYKKFSAANMSEEDLAIEDTLTLPDEITRPYRDLQQAMIQQIMANMDAMTGEWSLKEIQKWHRGAPKVCEAYFALQYLVVDPHRGPFYAADLLYGSQATNLINHLIGVQKQAENDLNSARGDMTLRIQHVKRTRQKFLHSGLFANKKKLFNEFTDAVAVYFTLTSYIKLLEQMIIMMPKMIGQFGELYNVHFMVYRTVCRNLYDTFHENLQVLSIFGPAIAIQDPFTLPLVDFQGLRPSLDAVVNGMNKDTEMAKFQEFLFDNPEIWESEDELKLSKAVSDYFVSVFSGHVNRLLAGHFVNQYNNNTKNPAAIICENILTRLADWTNPLFWKASGFDLSALRSHGSVYFSNSSPIISSAMNMLVQANPDLIDRPSEIKDRISIIKCVYGIPMYAYYDLISCRNTYRSDRAVGKHLYECTERDPRDWRTLSDLQPYSMDDDPSGELETRAAAYDEAVKRGIIRQNPDAGNEYQLVVWPSVDSLLQNAEDAISSADVKAVEEASSAIKQYRTSRKPERTVSIPNDGAYGYEARVREDYVVGSSKMIQMIRDELEKEDKLTDAFKNLQDAKQGIDTGDPEK